jgi:hypothetical protein
MSKDSQYSCKRATTENPLYIMSIMPIAKIINPPAEIQTISRGQVALWLQRLTPDQSKVEDSWGQGFYKITTEGYYVSCNLSTFPM